jgi:hypothetical protein
MTENEFLRAAGIGCLAMGVIFIGICAAILLFG